MANIITSCRILLSVIMLFSQTFSQSFYICYLFAGFTDMIDGSIARRLGIAGNFGEKLDSFADLVLVLVTSVKILPVIDISKEIIIWICIIALLKIVNIISGLAMHKQIVTVHSTINKVTGILLFLFPLAITKIPLKYSTIVVCTLATFAALQEGHIIRAKKSCG